MIKNILKSSLLYLILGFLAVYFLAPFVPMARILSSVKEHKALLIWVFMSITVFFTVVSMFFQFGIVYGLVKGIKNWKGALTLMGASLVLIFLTLMWMGISLTKAGAFSPGTPYFTKLYLIVRNMGDLAMAQKCFYSLFVIFLCTGFGYLLSFIVREKNMLVPVMLCCGLMDIWTVNFGFVSKTLAHAPEVIAAASSEVPKAGTGGFSAISTIGAGDFIFPALVFACVFRFNFNGRKNFWFMFGFLVLAMMLIILNMVSALPGLVFVGAAALIANWKEFTLTKKEILYIGIVFFILLTALILYKIFMR